MPKPRRVLCPSVAGGLYGALMCDPRGQRFAKGALALEVPLAAHGLGLGSEGFGMQKLPKAAAGRARALAGVVLSEPPLDVVGPADIGQRAAVAAATEDVDIGGHRRGSLGRQVRPRQSYA